MSLVRLLQVAGAGVVMTFFNVYMDAGLHARDRRDRASRGDRALFGGAGHADHAGIDGPLGRGATGYLGLICRRSRFITARLYPYLGGGGPWLYWRHCFYFDPLSSTFSIYMMDLIPTRYRSVMAGASETSAGLSFAVMALAGGYLIASQGYQNLFLLGAGETVLGTLIFWGYLRTRKGSER